MTRQRLLLGTLVALLLIAGWVYLVPDSAGGAPAAGRTASGIDPDTGLPAAGRAAQPHAAGTAATAGREVRAVLPLHIADLTRTAHGYTTGRDPWRFYEPPPPPPPPPHRPTAAELAAMREAEAARQRLLEEAARRAAADLAIPKPPPFTWSYLGNFGPAGRRIAVFTDGQRIWNAREGETLEAKFIVAQIGYESVDIAFVGFPKWPVQRLAVKK